MRTFGELFTSSYVQSTLHSVSFVMSTPTNLSWTKFKHLAYQASEIEKSVEFLDDETLLPTDVSGSGMEIERAQIFEESDDAADDDKEQLPIERRWTKQ